MAGSRSLGILLSVKAQHAAPLCPCSQIRKCTCPLFFSEGALDYVVLNSTVPPEPVLERYRGEGAALVTADPALETLGVKIVQEDLCEDISHMRILWEKQDLLRHDPVKLATILRSLAR